MCTSSRNVALRAPLNAKTSPQARAGTRQNAGARGTIFSSKKAPKSSRKAQQKRPRGRACVRHGIRCAGRRRSLKNQGEGWPQTALELWLCKLPRRSGSRGARRCSPRAFPFRLASFPRAPIAFPSFLNKLIWDLATWHFGGCPWKPGYAQVPVTFPSSSHRSLTHSPCVHLGSLQITYCFGTCPRGILEGARESLGGPREYTNGHKLLLGHTDPVRY